MTKPQIVINTPTFSLPTDSTITKKTVFGCYASLDSSSQNTGMVIAISKGQCPVWNDLLPYKAVTVKCKPSQENAVTYWLEYVHGGNSVTKRLEKDGALYLRSEYQCW